jgi:hypothetical protein
LWKHTHLNGFLVHAILLVKDRPRQFGAQLHLFPFQLAQFLLLVPRPLQHLDMLIRRLQTILDANVHVLQFGNRVERARVRHVDPLQLGGLHEKGVLVLGLAGQELFRLLLVQDGHGIVHLNVSDLMLL